MECKICGKIFTDYKVYDLPSDLKADSYICKSCFLLETLKWNTEHPEDVRQIQVHNDFIIVDGEQ